MILIIVLKKKLRLSQVSDNMLVFLLQSILDQFSQVCIKSPEIKG